jgi:hypothetical protein
MMLKGVNKINDSTVSSLRFDGMLLYDAILAISEENRISKNNMSSRINAHDPYF